MSINTHILNASKEILPYSNQLKLIVKSAITSVGESSFVRDLDIVFCYNPGAISDEMGGVGISSTNSYSMIISLNPRHQNFQNTINNELRSLIVNNLRKNGFI